MRRAGVGTRARRKSAADDIMKKAVESVGAAVRDVCSKRKRKLTLRSELATSGKTGRGALLLVVEHMDSNPQIK